MTNGGRFAVLLVAPLVVAAVAGCSGGATEAQPAAGCEAVSTTYLATVAQKLDASVTLGDAQAVKVDGRDAVWALAARITGEGMGDDSIGVWFVGGDPAGEAPSAVYTAEGMAQQFSTWAAGDSISSPLSSTDPSVDAARECLA